VFFLFFFLFFFFFFFFVWVSDASRKDFRCVNTRGEFIHLKVGRFSAHLRAQ